MKRRGVTMTLLWQEYRAERHVADGFFKHAAWKNKNTVVDMPLRIVKKGNTHGRQWDHMFNVGLLHPRFRNGPGVVSEVQFGTLGVDDLPGACCRKDQELECYQRGDVGTPAAEVGEIFW